MTNPAPRSAKLPITLVLAVALAAGLGLLAAQTWFARDGATTAVLQNGLAYPEPRALPAFTLDRADGSTLTNDDLRGRWTLLFIGFTHCPDVCPTTLATLAAASKHWQDLPATQQPRIVFVSVDPERDTATLADDYARHFTDAAIGVTADHERLTPFTRAMGMVYMTSPLDDGGYSVDHSVSVAVVDPDTRLVAQLRPPLQADRIAADLHTLMDVRR